MTALGVLAGQQAEISVVLRNFWAPATGVRAVLSTADPHARVDQGIADFGSLGTGGSGTNQAEPFRVSLDPETPFGAIPFTLTVSADGGFSTSLAFSLSISFTSDVSVLAGVVTSGLLPRVNLFQDYSGDGRPDILMVDLFDVFLYQNQGDGSFQRRNTQAGVPRSFIAWTSHFLDVDNDGDRDVLIGGRPQEGSRLLLNQGDGTTIDISASSGIASHGLFWSAALDYNGDGFVDVLGGGGTAVSPMRLLENQGDLTFVDRLADSGLPEAPFPSGIGRVATLDYDGDGDPDVLFAGFNAGLSLWRNEGDGTFTDRTAAAFPAFSPGSVEGVALGDCDNDGDVDLFATDRPQTMEPPSRILLNEAGVFRDAGDAAGDAVAFNLTGLWWGNEFFDFDNDEDLDLYVSKEVTFPGSELPALDRNPLFRNEGDCRFTLISDLAFPSDITTSVATASMADYDGDGDVDIYAPGSEIFGSAGGGCSATSSETISTGSRSRWRGPRAPGTPTGRR